MKNESACFGRSVILGLVLSLVPGGALLADDAYTITVTSSTSGTAVRSDFAGLSFGQGVLSLNDGGITGYLFDTNTTQSPKCTEVLTLCKNMGLKNLRLGGSAVNELVPYTDYGNAGIDALFAFASAAGIDVEFSLRQEGSYLSLDETMANYVWSNYGANLAYFCIGNEPNISGNWSGYADWRSSDPTDSWEGYATGIVANTASNIGFGAPDTCWEGDTSGTYYNGESWTQAFIADRVKDTIITQHIFAADQHHYVGGDVPASYTTSNQVISDMLQSSWPTTKYPWIYNNIFAKLDGGDWAYRITEANDHTGNGSNGALINGASNSFGGALWALDYMSWQSRYAHCWGVNFHNTEWIATDTLTVDPNGDIQVNPKACAILLFNQIHGSGTAIPQTVSISNGDGANITAYADGDASNIWVTIINKTNASVDNNAERGDITIKFNDFTATSASSMTMAPYPDRNDPTELQGTVANNLIANNATWTGSWSALTVSSNQVTLTAYTSQGVVVHIVGTHN